MDTMFWITIAYSYAVLTILSLIASFWFKNQLRRIDQDILIALGGRYVGIYEKLVTYFTILFLFALIAFAIAAVGYFKVAGIW